MFIFTRRNVLIFSVLLATVITAIFCFSAINERSLLNAGVNAYTIVLDAGHGGIDNGVTGIKTGVKESELNLLVVKKLEKYFNDAGFNVVLTRKNQAGLYGVATKNRKRKDMQKRKSIINKANPIVVISVHMNEYPISTRRGAQVFYKPKDENGRRLALNVQESLNEMESAVRSCSALTGDYYILNCSKYPSIIVECGFLSNPDDDMLLNTEEYREEISYAIFKGAIEFLSYSPTVNCCL